MNEAAEGGLLEELGVLFDPGAEEAWFLAGDLHEGVGGAAHVASLDHGHKL